MPECPSENELLELIVGGAISEERRRQLQDHLDDCPRCLRVIGGGALALTQSTGTSRTAAPAAPAAADFVPARTRIGRYVVEELVGSGAMGAVYAAFDPKLDRRIAIKLVRPLATPHAPELEDRLLREG